ncbi:SusD/RagB family nutrient-binding outer membrane lipoprotein [Aquimarina gracilis]|uniref:SusD/RagB family nutrient-binding outer membrane lipoprotein n=1 Tax=Aquimarina gracilis TaxID=874422 RepID=A0ABU5ZS61_9FLAO|nr:SusD/RagB family nutrient-binding outer membrane lipoprotein [Aquimarina gracilis]MEB3344892.1 SusD/RagB family nutrient-binding outer membrane lipoprotein [Aquimarina gracilis]
MKLNKKIRNGLLLLASIITLNSCETLDLDKLDNPSLLTPDSADPDLLLNNVELNFINFLEQINARQMEFARMEQLFGAYTGAFAMTAPSLDNDWDFAYSEMLQDNETLLALAEERQIPRYLGIAKVLKAYVFVSLVDTFGEVPFTEALQGASNANPSVDAGDVIYDAMFDLIDEGISDLSQTAIAVPNELFYGGDAAQWIRLANTLKLKMHFQSRLVRQTASTSAITSLVNSGNIITSSADDFVFQYSSTVTPADSRHPEYIQNYQNAGAADYMSNYYMSIMKDEKVDPDPRLRYYFYRQSGTDPEGDFLPCSDDALEFCYIDDFYWGRDHFFDEGVPNDNLLRTTWGVYPAGGAFDADTFLGVDSNAGAGGAGIFPLITSSFVNFMLAESALMINTPGDPRTYLENGIRESMAKVLNFLPGQVDPAFAATSTQVEAYVAEVLADYDAAADNNARLDIIVKEYFIALWGNGMEAYNAYRRTGFPSDIQSPTGSAGPFPRSFFYPTNAVNLNTSISQKSVTERVFWDNNPDGFID